MNNRVAGARPLAPGAPVRGVLSTMRGRPGPLSERLAMSDKSPRQSMTKKTGKSIKEKRADKRDKGNVETFTDKASKKK